MIGKALILKVKSTSFHPGDAALHSSDLEQVIKSLGLNL